MVVTGLLSVVESAGPRSWRISDMKQRLDSGGGLFQRTRTAGRVPILSEDNILCMCMHACVRVHVRACSLDHDFILMQLQTCSSHAWTQTSMCSKRCHEPRKCSPHFFLSVSPRSLEAHLGAQERLGENILHLNLVTKFEIKKAETQKVIPNFTFCKALLTVAVSSPLFAGLFHSRTLLFIGSPTAFCADSTQAQRYKKY